MRRCWALSSSTEKAMAMEMTRGIPSGMQTIKRAMAVEARSRARLNESLSTSLPSPNMTVRSQTTPKRRRATTQRV